MHHLVPTHLLHTLLSWKDKSIPTNTIPDYYQQEIKDDQSLNLSIDSRQSWWWHKPSLPTTTASSNLHFKLPKRNTAWGSILSHKRHQEVKLLPHLFQTHLCRQTIWNKQVPTVFHTHVAYNRIKHTNNLVDRPTCSDTTNVTPQIYPRFYIQKSE
jgi:hypothetical protein